MGPPNSVAIASPIPSSYFGESHGALSAFPSAYTFHGLVQPFIPTAHNDYDSTGRTLPKLAATAETATPTVHGIRTFVNNLPNLPALENPLSWWKRHLPGLPERSR